MLPNTAAMYECHFAVPMTGAILNTLNTRLDAEAIAFMLAHGEAKVLITDLEFSPVIKTALELLHGPKPLVIDLLDPEYAGGEMLGKKDYEGLLAEGDPDFVWRLPGDEWDAIALNYTSGTTGNPKGVVYHHRGAYLNAAYLNAASNIISWGMPPHSVYLWTLPMFHCNGWCFPWTLAANAGTSVCLRKVDPATIFGLGTSGYPHVWCADRVRHADQRAAGTEGWRRADRQWSDRRRRTASGDHRGRSDHGIQPDPRLRSDRNLRPGFRYGPASVCAKQPEWENLPIDLQAARNGRQGVRYHMQEAITVLDPVSMLPVPWDGETMGEIMFRGNLVMKGYLKNAKATQESFAGDWFHTGDLAVVHSDGYVKIKDRSKDVIISGGENISSLEVEDVLYRHPAVVAAAVVAKPDPKWGEVPAAFIELKSGATCTEGEIIEHCRVHLARFKVPKQVVFGELPKTSTGKIQKFVLRQNAQSALAIE